MSLKIERQTRAKAARGYYMAERLLDRKMLSASRDSIIGAKEGHAWQKHSLHEESWRILCKAALFRTAASKIEGNCNQDRNN